MHTALNWTLGPGELQRARRRASGTRRPLLRQGHKVTERTTRPSAQNSFCKEKKNAPELSLRPFNQLQ